MRTREIVSYINETLKAALSDERFNGSQFHSISDYFKREEGVVLMDVSDTGEGKRIEYDNLLPLKIYHINNGTKPATVKSQYGDSENRLAEITGISMVCVCSRDKVRMHPEQLSTLLRRYFPTTLPKQNLTDLNLNTCSLSFQGISYRGNLIWERDKLSDQIQPPSAIVIEVSYLIECSYKLDCVDIECC